VSALGTRIPHLDGTAAPEIIEDRSREDGIELPLPAEQVAIAMDVTGIAHDPSHCRSDGDSR
jgi:hypothetical protein